MPLLYGTHPRWYIGNTDPASDPTNRVRDGKGWVKTTNDNIPWGGILGIFLRDNGAWEPFPFGAVGAGSALVVPGLDGRDGEDGWPGPPGRQGDAGVPGADGVAGRDGVAVVGRDGEDGDQGWPGQSIVGPCGPAGLTVLGRDGDDGEMGWPGRDGATGPAGATGSPGVDGVSVVGPSGRDGEDGDDGWQGLAIAPEEVSRPARLKVAGTSYLSIPGVAVVGTATLGITANVVYYYPFTVASRAITLDSLVCEVTVIAVPTSKARMAVYEADADWQPTGLKVQTSEFAVDALAVNTMGSLATVLPPGRYLRSIASNGGPTLRTYNAAILGGAINTGASPYIYRWSKTRTYAAFPDPGVVADTVQQTSSSVGFDPILIGFTP